MRLWIASLALIVSLAAGLAAQSQSLPATGGNVEITPLAHAHVQLEFMGKVIHVDPNPDAPANLIKPADLILITDIHGDHMSPLAIDRVKQPSTIYVAPPALADRFPGKTEIMRNGETRTIDGVEIEAVAAYNLQRGPAAGQFYHPKGRANAYVLTLGGQRILFTGDTECTPEIKGLQNIAVAFVSMNLPFTMPPDEAAACVKASRPRIVYPYHYRQQDLEPADKNQTDFVAAMKGFEGVEVRVANFYPAQAAGPGRGGRGGN